MGSTHDFDVAIIGSGFGGSVAALRLSEKGYRVGVVCHSDDHKGRPGATRPGASTFGAQVHQVVACAAQEAGKIEVARLERGMFPPLFLDLPSFS